MKNKKLEVWFGDWRVIFNDKTVFYDKDYNIILDKGFELSSDVDGCTMSIKDMEKGIEDLQWLLREVKNAR